MSESWPCNFAKYRNMDGLVRSVTSKHCLEEQFPNLPEDIQISNGARPISFEHRTAVLSDTTRILEYNRSPIDEGSTVSVIGCYPETSECFRISGQYEKLYLREGKWISGVWVSREGFGKLIENRKTGNSGGLSGSPAISSEETIVGVYSAQVETKEAYGMAIIPIP